MDSLLYIVIKRVKDIKMCHKLDIRVMGKII